MNLGHEVICDFYGCDPETLKRKEGFKKILNSAVEVSGANIVNTELYYFEPYGITGIVVITESHLSIHTWPEYKYAAIDFFSCNPDINFRATIGELKKYFKPEKIEIKELDRGKFP